MYLLQAWVQYCSKSRHWACWIPYVEYLPVACLATIPRNVTQKLQRNLRRRHYSTRTFFLSSGAIIGVLLAADRSTYAGCRVRTFFLQFQIVRLHLAFALCNDSLLPWDKPALLSLQNQCVCCRLRHLDPSWDTSTFHSRSCVHSICIRDAHRASSGLDKKPLTRQKHVG